MIKGIIVCALASGAGKTTTTLALLSALRLAKIPFKAAKAGPDFIDTAWLAKIAGQPALNLDIWMAESPQRLAKTAASFAGEEPLVIEGAMGLYDGGKASSNASLAKLLGLPILLLLNAAGAGETIAAQAYGALNYKPGWLDSAPDFCGIICTHVGSKRHRDLLEDALKPVCAEKNIPMLGFLPKEGAPKLPARHLGLKQACECGFDILAAAKWLSDNCCALKLPCFQKSGRAKKANCGAAPEKSGAPLIAIAKDEAFSFMYADLAPMLESYGAGVAFFSPLHDTAPPPCAGIYIPGGYPELWAEELSKNQSMLSALRALAQKGIPIYGECGGYMYLCEGIFAQTGDFWPMAGLLRGKCRIGGRLASLGYRRASCAWLPGAELRGHEFHYGVLEEAGGENIWRVADRKGNDLGYHGGRAGLVWASWLHLYPQGSRPFWRYWLDLCRRNKR